jgi:hypothetical protein
MVADALPPPNNMTILLSRSDITASTVEESAKRHDTCVLVRPSLEYEYVPVKVRDSTAEGERRGERRDDES